MRHFYTTITLLLLVSSTMFAQQQHSNVELLSQLRYNENLSDIWGYENEGNEYALIGLNNAFSIVDITDATNPVEVDRIGGPRSIWRDVKTWDHYAYVTNETGEGCLIVDLQYLPDSTVTYNFTGEGTGNFNTAHNVFIDELGIMYIIGYSPAGGCLMYDLNEDPTKPKFVGRYDAAYVHDLYARDNILYTSEGGNGEQVIVDIQDKSNPIILGKVSTYGYTHNCWISDDAKTMYTTDETGGTWVVSWDITDPTDIKELDKWQSSPGQGVVPHNTFVFGDFLLTSYYTDGVTITNVKDPANMIQVGNYDTSPNSGGGTSGCWGVYPYLPSGNVIASDGSEGLFVLKPEYKDAAYLNGLVVDIETGDPIFDAIAKIEGENFTSDLGGIFKYGGANEETFNITVTKFGYDVITLENVKITPGETTEVKFELTQQAKVYNITGNLFDAEDSEKLSEGSVVFTVGDTQIEYQAVNGKFEIDSIYIGKYNVKIGSWGYLPIEMELNVAQTNQELNLYLNKGIYDDFSLDYGWTNENNRDAGSWELATPIKYSGYGIDFSLGNDVDTDSGDKCYITGNTELFDFVTGTSILQSPVFDMSQMENPYINFYSYIVNYAYNGYDGESKVEFKLTNGDAEIVVHTDELASVTGDQWNFHNYALKDQIELTETMQFSVTANGSPRVILDSGFDFFQVIDSATVSVAANSIVNDDDVGVVAENSVDNSFNIAENDTVACESAQYYIISYNRNNFSDVSIEEGVLSFSVNNFSADGDYEITYGVNCGNTDNKVATVLITIGDIVGIDEIAQNKFQLSPNPASNAIFVEGLDVSINSINYKLYDVSGQLMASDVLDNSSKINLKQFNSGVYFVKFYAGNKIHSINKIIKK